MVLGVFAFLPGGVFAQTTYTWTAAGVGNFSWNNNRNWLGGSAPPNNAVGAFVWSNATRKLANNNNRTGIVMTDLTFATIAGANTLSGNSITLSNASGNGAVVNNSANLQTLNLAGIALGTAYTINAASGAIQINSAIANNGNLLNVTGAQNTTLNNVLSGLGGLTKLGTGTLITVNNNTYGGVTTVGGGTLAAAVLANSGTVSSIGTNSTIAFTNTDGFILYTGGSTTINRTINLAGVGGFSISNTATALTLSGVISNTGTLAKAGAGTLIISADNTGTWGARIDAGTLQVGTGGAAGSLGTGAITNSSQLVFNRSDTHTVNNTISGSGTLASIGTGTLVLGGSNSFTGQTLASNGAIRVTNSFALGSAAGNTVVTASGSAIELAGNISLAGESVVLNGTGLSSGGALRNISGTNTLGGTVTLGSDARVNSDSGTLTLGNAGTINGTGFTLTLGGAGNTIVNSVIATGAGGLAKDGVGTLVLAGNNTFTGATTVSQGTLQIGNGGSGGNLSSNSAVTLSTNTTLAFRTGATTRNFDAIVGGNGAVVMDSSGGIVNIQRTNTYTGGTTVLAGELHAITSQSFGTGAVTLSGAAFTNLAEIHYTATNSPLAIGPLTLNGNAVVALSAGNSILSAGAITIGSTNNFINIAGTTWAQGTNTLIAGTSISYLSGSNNILLTGPSLNGGTLSLGQSNTIGRSTYTFGADAATIYVIQTGTALDLLWTGAENSSWNTNATNWQNAPNGLNPDGTNIAFFTDDNVWFGNAATNAPVSVDAAGVAAGEMAVTNSAGTVVFNGGAITNHNLAKSGAGNLVISNTLDLEGGAEPVGTLSNTGSGNVTLTGTVVRGRMLQAGTGTLTLSASNAYTGGTTISNGVVVAGADNALGTGAITVSGGTLSIGSTLQTNATVTLQSGTITGSGTITSTGLEVQSGSASVVFAGTADLTKSGTGTVTLTGANTFGGLVNLQQGTLSVGADNNLGASTNSVLFSGASTLAVTGTFTSGRAYTLGDTGTFNIASGNALSLGGSLSGSGLFTKSGAGTLVIDTDTNTQSGGILVSAGVLQVGAGGASGVLGGGTVTNNAALIFNRTGTLSVTNIIAGSGGITKLGTGTVTLSGPNTYAGQTIIAAGALRAADSTALGAVAGSTTVSNGAALELSGGIAIGSQALSIGGTGIGSGGALRNISGSNSYGGTITLVANTRFNSDAGTLALTNASTLNGSGFNLTVGGDGNTLIVSDIAIGTGTVTKDGTGVLVYAGANSYTGGTTISSGTLQIGNNATFSSSLATAAITNNGSLAFRIADGSVNLGAPVSGTGNVLVDSIGGTVTLSGTNTYSGGTTINAGTLAATAAGSLGSGDVTLTGTDATNRAVLTYNSTNAPLGFGALLLDGETTISLAAGTRIASTGAVTVNDTNNFIAISGAWATGTNILVSGTAFTLNLDSTIQLTGSTINNTVLSLGGSTIIGRTTYLFNSNASSLFVTLSGTNFDLLWTGNSNNIWNTAATNWVVAPGGVATVTNSAFFAGDNVYFGSNATLTNIRLTNAVAAGNVFVTNTSGTVRLGDTGTLSAQNLAKTGAGDLVISNTLGVAGVLTNSGSGNVTLAGALTNGSLFQNGAGTMTLSASNSFAGGVTLSSGTLVAGTSGALGGGALTVGGGTLSMGATAQSKTTVTLDGGSITGTGTLTGTSFLVRNGLAEVNLAGTGGLTKSTSGTVTLSGSNSFTGGVAINGGTLSVSSDANLGAAANGITFGGTNTDNNLLATASFSSARGVQFNNRATVTTDTGVALTFSGTADGSGALEKAGTGTLILANSTNNRSGGTLISAGVLQIGTGDVFGTLGGGDITNNGGLVINRAGTLDFAGIISGTGGLTNRGPGVTLLGGANTYTGDTAVNGGTLRLTNSGTLGNGGNVIVSADGFFGVTATLDLNGNNATIGSLTLGGPGDGGPKTTLVSSGSGTLTLGGDVLFNGEQGNQGSSTVSGNLALGGATRTFTVNGATNQTLSVSTDITGASGNGLTKTGGGVLSLGGSNSFDGTLAINQGTVSLDNASALAGGGIITFGGGTLRYSSNNTLDVSGRITNSSGAISIDTGGQNVTWATALDVSNTNGLSKLGTGTLTLTTANNYTGATAVNGGTLAISAANQISSGTLSIGNGTLLSLSNSYTLSQSDITLTGAGTIAAQSGTISMSNIANGGNMLTFAGSGNIAVNGVISGTGGMTKTGTGTLILTGPNAFLGPVFLTQGAFLVSGNTAGFTNVSPGLSTVSSGATIFVEGNVPRGRPLILNGTGIDGQGAWQNLSGTNAQVGAVYLGSDTRIGSVAGTMTLSNTLTGTNFNLTVGGAGNFVLNALALGTDATITKDGTGTLTLGGASDHENTVVQSGQLNVNSVLALGSSTGGTVTLSNGVKLDNTSGGGLNVSVDRDINVHGSLEFVGTRNLGMGAGTVNLGSPDTNGYTTFNVVNNLLAFDGQVTGSSGIIKLGAGTLQLGYAGSNSFTGLTQVNAGELYITGPGVSFTTNLWANTGGIIRLGAGVSLPTNTVVLNGGQYIVSTLTPGDVVIATNTILTADAQLWDGQLTINPGVTVTNPGITDLLGYTPTNFVSNHVVFKEDSKLVVTDGFTIAPTKGLVLETNTVTFQVNTNDLLVESAISGAGTLRKTGAGHIHLFTNNSYSGGTYIEEGWVGILADGSLGTGKVTLAGGVFEGGFEASPTNFTVTVDSNRVVEMLKGVTSTIVAQDNTTLIYNGSIAEVGTNSGPANLVVGLATVDGTVALGGTNSYTGFTRIQNGATLEVAHLADGGTASGIGSSSSAATNLVLLGSSTLRYTGAAVSTDRLFTLGNLGGTIDSSGTGMLDFTNTGEIGYNAQTGVRTLTLAGSTGGSLAVLIGENVGTTSLLKTGDGMWTLSNSNTYSGGTTIAAGTLRIGADANLGTGSLIFSTGSTGKLLVTNSISMTRAVTLTGNGEIDTVADITTTLTGDIAGAGVLAKSGAGTLILSNTVANTWSGGMIINDGRVKMLTAQAVGTGNITNNGVFEIAVPTAVAAGSTSNIYNTISGTGSVVRSGVAGQGISLAGTNDNTYTGLTVVNSGTLRLEKTGGAKAFGGDAEVNGGALIISGSEQTPTNSTITVNAGTLDYSPTIVAGKTNTFGTLTKSGGIIRTYGNTFSVATANFSGGGTNLINRSLVNSNNDGTSAGKLIIRAGGDGLVFSGTGSPTLTIDSAASGDANRLVLQGNVTANMTDGTAQIVNGGSGSVAGTIDLDGGDRTFAISNGLGDTDMLVTATITNGAITKTGEGRLALAGGSTYSGGTTLSAGQLRLDATNAAGTGTLTQSDGTSVLEINAGGTVANAMSVYNVAFVNGGNTLSGSIALNNAIFTNVASGVTNTITGELTGTGGITKQGDGGLIIAGTVSNSFTGTSVVEGGTLILSNSAGGAISGTSIQVDSGASLVLAGDDQIGDTTGLILNGGTFITGTDTTHFSETLGTLTLSATSTIDLGSYSGVNTRQLVFANSSAITWATNATLIITNWQGIAQQSSTVSQILFGTGGLTSTQLAQVYWAGQDIAGGELIGGGGELVPVPEPRVYAAALALLAAVAWRERKRLRAIFCR